MLKAKDVMTSQVVTVGSDDTVSNVASLLVTHGISAVPVVDEGNLVGIVSEGDLVHRDEIGTAFHQRSWWLRLFTDSSRLAAEYTKSHARRAGDVMTRRVVTVSEDTPLADIADLLEKKQIKRVPVVHDGALLGIVSRANLIRALAIARETPLVRASANDSSIRDDLLKKLRAESWSSIGGSDVTVSGGVVAFWGAYRSEEEREATRILAENLPGVREIQDNRVPLEIPYGIA